MFGENYSPVLNHQNSFPDFFPYTLLQQEIPYRRVYKKSSMEKFMSSYDGKKTEEISIIYHFSLKFNKSNKKRFKRFYKITRLIHLENAKGKLHENYHQKFE